MRKQGPISIRGIVIAAAWTSRGDITEIDIAGYDEKRYRVVDDPIGGQLRDHIKKSIVVEGVVETKKGVLTITVKQFRLVNPGTSKSPGFKSVTPSL